MELVVGRILRAHEIKGEAVVEVFFFSSRRRHTRCGRDWSSDVCSSDLTVLAIAGTSLVSAQQDPVSHRRGAGLSAEDVSALTDARVAALHAGLKLSPEQEKNWPAFEQSYREV